MGDSKPASAAPHAEAEILAHVLSRAKTEPLSDDAVAFLQQRVARFGAVTTVLFSVALALRALIFALMGAPVTAFFEHSYLFHVLAVFFCGATWLLATFGRRSLSTIRIIESSGLVGCGTAIAAAFLDTSAADLPQMSIVLPMTYLVVARSVWVPSTGARTLALAGALTLPMLMVVFGVHFTTPQHLLPPGRSAVAFAALNTCVTASFWALTMLLCTHAAQVIYGLRQTVRDVRKLGQYHLEAKLGEGGMGVVYRARHAMLRRETAVKLLKTDAATAQSIERFAREVRCTAQLSHPNTVTIFDYGRTPDGTFYYAMELLRGATLAEVVDLTGAQPSPRVLKILHEAAGALQEAHNLNLVHRDIKPSNIMLCEQGGAPDVTKVLDFGLAKPVAASGNIALSTAGAIVGTPLYMAPEMITAPEHLDARSDLYSLGAVGYYLLTGSHVFDGASAMDVCMKQVKEQPVPPSERLGQTIPTRIEDLVLHCLAKSREERPQSALALQRQLEGCPGFGEWRGAWWWEEYGPALALDTVKPDVSDTLSIDLQRRT